MLNRRSIAWLTAAAFCAAPALWAQAQEKVTLQQKFPAGKAVMTMAQTTDMTVSMNGNAMGTQKMKQIMTMATEVSAPNDEGVQTMVVEYTRVQQDVSAMGMKMGYDSDDEDTHDSPMAAVLKHLVGAKITATIKKGEITEVTGADELWRKIAKENPQMKQMSDQMAKSMGNEAMKQMMKAGAIVLPDKPVGVGDTWTVKQAIPVPMLETVEIAFDCKLKNLKGEGPGRVAVIGYTGQMSIDKARKINAGMGEVELKKFASDFTGSQDFNVAKGTTMHQVMDMEMKMTMVAGQGQEIEMDGTVKQEMTLKPVE